ncbi:hypothetical protein H4Q26_017109 [Puccinia striiformis f. sp. tritici PST-130]|nr:hypothetical protein H4Q26_017109 [Puccinia striiformis f. sp. tritici PST-130]
MQNLIIHTADLKLHNRPSKPSPTAANSAQNNHSDHQSAANNSTHPHLPNDPLTSQNRTLVTITPTLPMNPSPNKANRDPKSKQSVTTQRSQDPDGRAEKSTLTSKSDSKKSNENQDHQQHLLYRNSRCISNSKRVSKIESTTGPDTTDHDHNLRQYQGNQTTILLIEVFRTQEEKANQARQIYQHLTRANHQSSGDNAKTEQVGEENHSRKQPRSETTEEEEEDQSDLKAKPIRRQMSGSTDQFDFDAQQRLHAGPGGGMVKNPAIVALNQSIHPRIILLNLP